MQIDEVVIAQIVRAVIEALRNQGLLAERDGSAVPPYGCGVPRQRPMLQSPARMPAFSNAPASPARTVQEEGVILARPAHGRRCIVTEEIVRDHLKDNVRRLTVPSDALITPLAVDTAKEKGLQLVRQGRNA